MIGSDKISVGRNHGVKSRRGHLENPSSSEINSFISLLPVKLGGKSADTTRTMNSWNNFNDSDWLFVQPLFRHVYRYEEKKDCCSGFTVCWYAPLQSWNSRCSFHFFWAHCWHLCFLLSLFPELESRSLGISLCLIF